MSRSRNEEIKQDRKRRDFSKSGRAKKLHVNEDALDRENFAYRFVNNVTGRVETLSKEEYGWSVCSDRSGRTKEDNASMGSSVSAHAGVTAEGEGFQAVLMKKPIEWFNEDKAAMQASIAVQEEALKAGTSEEDGKLTGKLQVS